MFGNVDTKIRPLKLAYLVDPNNAEQTREAIRLSSSLWGGAYFPIIPLYKHMPPSWADGPLKPPPAKKVLLGYLEAFDPDVLVQISKTVPDFIMQAGLEIIKPDGIWSTLKEHLSPQFGIGIFELANDIFEENFRYKAKYPLKVLLPKLPDELSLFWASFFGEFPPAISSILEKRYSDALEIQTVDFGVDKLTEVMARDVLFPRRMTQWGLAPHNRSGWRKEAAIYYLDAAKTADIVDFWNLRALGRQVLPLPKQFQNDPGFRDLLINFLKAHRRPWRHNPKVCDHASFIRSHNSTMEEMQEYAKTLKIEVKAGDPSDSPFFSLQHWYPRVWDEWGRDKDGAVPDDQYGENESSVEISETKNLTLHFKPLLPKFAHNYAYHGQPRCANELSFRLYGSEEFLAEVFPKSSGEQFTRAISGLTSFRGDWHVGRNGLVKLVRDEIGEGRDIPLAETTIFAWLRDAGWQPTLSAPGLLAKQIYKKLDGNVAVLRNEQLLGLLEHMNGGHVKQDGAPVEENEVGQERNLSVGEVKNRLETSEGDRLYEYLLAKGIFKLGLRTQCPHCLRRSWLQLTNVRDSVACPRCLNPFPAVGNVDSGTWSYKTTGPFSIPKYAEGAYSVLLTLSFFSDHKMTTLRTTPVVSFTAGASGKEKLEADVALFWQESLFGEKRSGILFGECKTYNRFEKKDFKRMSHIATMFPGAVLVFSTLRKSLTAAEITGITRIAKKGRKYWKVEHPINPVLVLTGTELLNWQGPPNCWDDATKKKFDHPRGLLSLCDATQQIYLQLPSWHDDWRKKWDERHRQRQAKQAIAGVASPIATTDLST